MVSAVVLIVGDLGDLGDLTGSPQAQLRSIKRALQSAKGSETEKTGEIGEAAPVLERSKAPTSTRRHNGGENQSMLYVHGVRCIR